jgi:hypothetical protein
MKKSPTRARKVLIAFCLSFQTIFATPALIDDDKILNGEVSAKINALGEELMIKSGIYVGVGIYENLGGKDIFSFFKELNLKEPYAFLLLAKAERKVEIFADPKTLELFDKEKILSPYPYNGSILPILSSKNGQDIYNAAMLNGYADLAERIADSKGVKLQNAIGNQNKFTLDVLRAIVYGSLAIAIVSLLRNKFRKKNA